MYADISDFYLIKKTNMNQVYISWYIKIFVLYIIIFPSFQESYTYKDPITEFVECLYVNFDFDSAQKKLRECESVSNHFKLH